MAEARVALTRRCWLVGLGLGLAGASAGCRHAPAQGIVLIVVDTLRADHLGLYGYARPTSPALDRHARRAVVFERAWASSPWTLPSMATLLTGQWPSRHGAGSRLRESDFEQVRRLADGTPTLAERLRSAGYATGAVVNNGFLAPGAGLERGFSTYDHRPASNFTHRRADRSVDAALAWLDAHSQERFFLLVHLFDPHLAYDAPPPVRGRFTSAFPIPRLRPGRPQDVRARLASLDAGQRAGLVAAYDEEVAFVDEQLERLFASLETRGLWSRALIVLTADHGEEFFDHGGFEHGHTVYEELLHVPLLVWAPGVAARRETTPVSLADVAPTLLEAQALAASPSSDGASLWPLITRGQALPPRALLAEGTLHLPERRALLRWPLKLSSDESSGRRQLFDLSVDPRERVDLAGARPRDVQRLAYELEVRLREAGAASHGTHVPVDPRLREDLKSLGYVE